MTDRELLELAAKGAGYTSAKWQDMRGWGEIRYGLSEALDIKELDSYWNPLTRDGDALRLAVKLRLTIRVADHEIEVFDERGICLVSIGMLSSEDYVASTRFAIVRAVAEIGKEKGL